MRDGNKAVLPCPCWQETVEINAITSFLVVFFNRHQREANNKTKRRTMDKTNEVLFSQRVEKGVNYTIWNIPKVKSGDRWRIIRNGDRLRKANTIVGHAFENSITEVKRIMENLGWRTELMAQKKWCHEHLYYVHYYLRCWKQKQNSIPSCST